MQLLLDVIADTGELPSGDGLNQAAQALSKGVDSNSLRAFELAPRLRLEEHLLSIVAVSERRKVVVGAMIVHDTVAELEIVSLSEDEIDDNLLGGSLRSQVWLGKNTYGFQSSGIGVGCQLENSLRSNVNVTGHNSQNAAFRSASARVALRPVPQTLTSFDDRGCKGLSLKGIRA